MSYASLREFLGAVEGIGELKTIRNADWNLEIGALTEWYAAQQKNPCLLFDRIVGYPEGYRVCTLYLASPNRTALALGMPLNEHPVRYVDRWRRRVRVSGSLPALRRLWRRLQPSLQSGSPAGCLVLSKRSST